ncbi:membrane protein [Beggiatoa sp. PS]|nr:membrane protein [Beggiatoa sp. PS]
MKIKCFIAVVLILGLTLILIDFSFLVISSVLGIVAALLAIESAFIYDYGKKNQEIFDNLCIIINNERFYLKSFTVKKILVLIDFAKEDQEFAEKIEHGLKKEGIISDLISNYEKSSITILEQKLQAYQVIITLYHNVPESWIIARHITYVKIIAKMRHNGIAPPTIILCTTKDKESIKKWMNSIDIIHLNQPNYKKHY